MPDLAKASLVPLKPDFENEDTAAGDKSLVVQFNPETLKVSYQNQIQQPEGGDKKGPALFVGSGTTKMSCTLWFDVTAPQPTQKASALNNAEDVRKLTNAVAFFMSAKKDDKDPKKFIPPPVEFRWGSFRFRGVMESLEESLELFSAQGKPLRASVGISIAQQKIIILPPEDIGATQKKAPGTKPTTPVPQGSSVQKMAGPGWQGVAQANNIENPRLPTIGLRLDMSGR